MLVMPHGYHQPYIAESDEPYWHYRFGNSPLENRPDGTIASGGLLYLQGPPSRLGTHQSGYLHGVGRIIVRIGGFRPAPAAITNC
jgi:hypothetical protein